MQTRDNDARAYIIRDMGIFCRIPRLFQVYPRTTLLFKLIIIIDNIVVRQGPDNWFEGPSYIVYYYAFYPPIRRPAPLIYYILLMSSIPIKTIIIIVEKHRVSSHRSPVRGQLKKNKYVYPQFTITIIGTYIIILYYTSCFIILRPNSGVYELRSTRVQIEIGSPRLKNPQYYTYYNTHNMIAVRFRDFKLYNINCNILF